MCFCKGICKSYDHECLVPMIDSQYRFLSANRNIQNMKLVSYLAFILNLTCIVFGDSDPLDTVAHYDIMYIVNLKNQSN